MPTEKAEIERYLATGDHDHVFAAWPGHNLLERAKRGTDGLRGALLARVRARTTHAVVPEALANLDIEAFTRTKVEPMVHGLFPAIEQPPVLDCSHAPSCS